MNKIEALRKAADLIESNAVGYNWHSMISCNCGILAQVLLNVEQVDMEKFDNELDEILYFDYESDHMGWSFLAEMIPVCETNGLEIPYLLKTLLKAGFTSTEITELENLSDNLIRGKVGLPLFQNDPDDLIKNHSESVVAYFREKANRLEVERGSYLREHAKELTDKYLNEVRTKQQFVPVQVNNI